MQDLPPLARAPVLLLGFVALLTGIAGALFRLGVGVPAPATAITWHGALMASAFFGTLISLERAVAIGRLWAYLAPAASGLGGLVLVLGAPEQGFWLLEGGAFLFGAASLAVWRRQPALHTAVLALGALCLLGANLWLALAQAPERAVPLWIAFFVLTIGGERLELSRLTPVPPRARVAFGVLSALIALDAFAAHLPSLGVLLLGLAAWLGRFDLATRTIRAQGLTRYIAVCLVSGYVWLAVGGALLGLQLARDAALHAILLGFVFSMVFGHAPVILPAVLRVAFPYGAALYAPLALLHASVLVRVAADLADAATLKSAAGAGNALAIVLFILTAATLALSARGRR